ncbi:TonB family protein [Hymenobacter busanensis]|uniref:TonB family protein n=1 Tax=Hymenobacter busanensis TaxID=2607656 RepID=A0A7L4ZW62_9BACT|nr:energy transducer TonB [Hymenobacter busanensis]KAA9332429.1 TonB family protein [Hymenobacter busanensis]QHJ07233.1 TonB family protein [Hymenobacter busanensis]
MKYHLLFILLLATCAASAQTTPAAPQQTTVLRPGRMQAQAKPAANRPDVAPQFIGGPAALGEYLQANVQYPEAARSKALSGSVLVGFTIGTDGRPSGAQVVKALSPECDAEALRVIGAMPAWKPALRKGQPVPVPVQLPVPFGNSSNLKVEKSKVKFE